MNKIITVKIGNVKSRLFGFLPDYVLHELYDKLSFQKTNMEYSQKVIDGKWDGYTRLFDRYQKTFQTGLISLVHEVLKNHGYKLEIDDQRVKPEQNRQWNLILNENIPSLYDFQQEAVHLAKKHSRGSFSIATGAGKTLTFTAIIAELKISPVIIYVPTLLLLYQTKEEIEKFLKDKDGKPIEVGIVGNGECDIKDITVMTIQTAITAFDMEYDKNKDKIVYLTPEQIQKKNEQLLKRKRVNLEDPDETEDLGFVVTRKEVLKGLINNVKVVITDESHRSSSAIYQEVLKQSPLAYYRFAASVHPNSIVEIKGEMFGDGQICSIENVFCILNEQIPSFFCNNYEIIDVDHLNIYSRSLSGQKVTWNKIKKVIRHKYNDKLYNIQVGGQTICVTGEHSVFTIDDKDELCVKNAKDIKKADKMLYDLGDDYSEENNEHIIDMFDVINKYFPEKDKQKIRIACDLSNISRNDSGYNHKIWWQCRNRSKYGHNLPLSKYLSLEDKIGDSKFIYLESANGNTINRFINLQDLSYLFGYFLGDGWISGNKVSFAVNERQLGYFLEYLGSIKIFTINAKIYKMDGKSYEIQINHKLLSRLFLYIFGNVKFYNKNIPNYMIYNWSKENRVNLLKGLIDSYGSYNKNGESVDFCTCSYNLHLSVRALLRSLGHTSTVFIRKACPGGWIRDRQIIGKYDSYYIRWSIRNGENGDKKYQRENKRIHAVNSYVRKIEQTEENFDGYVYDFEMEGHPSFTIDGILVHNSATNFREDNTEMLIQAIFGKILLHVPCSELIRRPEIRIVRPYIFMVDVPDFQQKKFTTYAQIRKNCIVISEQRNKLIADITQNIKQYGPTLLLVGIIDHGKILEKMIPGSVFISGKTPKKKKQQSLEDLMSGKLEVLIASPIIDEGLNLPELRVLMLCDGGKAATKLYQRVGRVVREVPGKKYGIVIDFSDENEMLGKHASQREALYLREDEWILTNVSADKVKSLKGK